MSVAQNPKPRKKPEKKGQIFCNEAQNVGSKHRDDVDEPQSLQQPKATSDSKDIINNSILSTKKKDFVIPRKKKQAKELLQSHRFDSRETKELLRSVQLSLRDPNFWSSYKFERVEFVNNEKLGRKYGEKKQALRLETMRTNRELEDKFAFLFITSRSEVKSICEHGIQTGNSSLTSLGDPKLGVYLCRFADVIHKRPLTTEDAGYLLVFRVVKGKVRFIGGSNPELQPTPHHDCHVSKSLTTLSSNASHSDVFESSQLYFYEIDENSDDFHVKHPRQVLPYAVLTFSILKPERQQIKLDDKSEGKKAVVTGYDLPSSADENILTSPNRIESQDDLISDANVSWSGVLAVKKKQLAYVDFLSYSRKKHPLPINVDHFNIDRKLSHDDLRSLLKCPVFSNGKPASSGVCIELSHGRKFIYYEVRVVNQIQEKFDELLSHFVEKEMAGIIEFRYFKGPIYVYLIPTSKLTNDIGITDRKSPLALHALVQVRHVRCLPSAQADIVPNEKEQEQDAGINDTVLSEAVVKSQLQEIFKKKYEEKKEKLHGKTKKDKISALTTRSISLEDGKNTTDKSKSALDKRRKSTEVRLSLPPDGSSHEKRVQYQKDAQKWVDSIFSSGRKEKSVDISHSNESLKASSSEKENLPSKDASNTDQGVDVEQAPSAQPEDTKASSLDNTAASSLQSENKNYEIDFLSVQNLIREFQNQDKQGKSAVATRSSSLVDPRLQRRLSLSSSQDNKSDKPSSIPPLLPPPIPPPPPPPISPFLSATLPLPVPIIVVNTPVSKTTTSQPSSATGVPLVTSPVSPPAIKRQEMLIPGLEPTGSPAFHLMREKVSFMNQSICTSDTYLKDSIISTQSVTTWNQMHPSSPIIVPSSSDITPTRTKVTSTPVSICNGKSYNTVTEDREHDQELQTRTSFSRDSSPKVALSPPVSNDYHPPEKCTARSDMLDSDIPSYDNVVINRPLTQAEKNSSRAIREIKNILLRNRDVVKNTSSEDDSIDDDHHTGHKPEIPRTVGVETMALKPAGEDEILQKHRLDEAEHGSRKPKEYPKKENVAKGYVGKDRPTEDRYVHEKDERNVDERSVGQKQPIKNLLLDKNTSIGTPEKRSLKSDSACSSPQTPELKNGLDLLDNLICPKRSQQPSAVSQSEHHRHQTDPKSSRDSGRRSKSRSRETTPRKEKPNEERKKILPTRKRKVMIKKSINTLAYENKWDDITSDISDTELSLDSDEYVSENRKNSDRYRDKTSPRSKDASRPHARDGLELNRHYDRYTKEKNPTRRTVSIGSKRESGMDTHIGYREDHDDWDREWKRRKLDQDQGQEIPESSSTHDNESTHSDSAMSISSLDSVSFEYAVPNDEESHYSRYRFVRTSPMNGGSLEVTITRDVEPSEAFPSHSNPDNYGVDPYHTHLIPPSSPVEVDMTASPVRPDSPGTPETAVPSEDFLHTNIGYWASGSTTKEGTDILTQDMDEKCFKPPQQEAIEDSMYENNNQGTWSAPSSPYRGPGDDRDVTAQHYEREEPVVKNSRGEGYCQRGCSSSGASTGYDYDNTSYTDRNQHTNPDYYRPIERDGHSLNYDNIRDLNDICQDRYPHTTDRYDDLEDRGLFYASRSPYEDIDSPRGIGCVEELGSNERYYTSDKTDSYSTSNRHGSPLYIGGRSCQYSEQKGNIDNNYGRRSPTPEEREMNNNDFRWRGTITNNERRSPTPEGREVDNDDYRWRGTITNDEKRSPSPEEREMNNNDFRWRGTITNNERRSSTPEEREMDNDDYRWSGTISNDEQPPQYSPERNEADDDRYRQRSPLAKNTWTSEYSPKRSRTFTDHFRTRSCSPHISNSDRYSSSRRGGSDDGYGPRPSLENTGRQSYSPDRREIQDDNYGQRSPMINSKRQSYSPDRRVDNDDSYGQRSPMVNSKRRLYSPDRRGDNDDNYGQRSPMINSKRQSYSPDQRVDNDDSFGQRSPMVNSKRRLYSPDRRGDNDDNYRQRSPMINSKRRSYSPERRVDNDDSYGQRSHMIHSKRQLYSPDRRGDSDESYGQRSSLENNERSLQYSPDQRGVTDNSYGWRSTPTSSGRRSLYSAYPRGGEYTRRSHSPVDMDDHHSRYSPERTHISDDEYGENYKVFGNDIESGREYRQGYQNDQEYPLGIEEEIDSHFPDDVYQDEEEPQGCFSEDEDNGRDLQPSCTFDGVEPSYGSDGGDTPEYYDKEQHKYLDDIAENSISATTLALDHAVFDGIKDFPVQLLELAKYLRDISKRSSEGDVVSNADSTDLSGNCMAVSHDPRLMKGRSNGDGSAYRPVTEAKRKKKDHRKIIKPFPKKQSCFYVYNPDNDPECEAVKHYMLKTGAQFLDVSDQNNLTTMTGELRVLVRRKHKQSVHRISNLAKLKLRPTTKFALFNTVEDVSKKSKAYAAIFQYGGVLIPDDAILRTADPALLEALLGFMAEQNAIHQKFFWVMNIRYIAYKKLGSQRPLTWRDAFVLDLLRKYRNERFVNIINKDYVLENLSPVQRYLDTALKQQLELMSTYRHYILLSDLNKQVVEVSWFFNRGIGFMNVKEWLHLFAGEAKTRQLLSASKYTKGGSEYTLEGTRHDTLQYDTIDSPEDDESIEPSSLPAMTSHITTEYFGPSHEGHRQYGHLSRSLSCNMVSRSANYKDNSNMKETRLEILLNINNVKTKLINNMGPNEGKDKFKDCVGIQGSIAKQRQYERSRSYEPRLRVHNERVIPRSTVNHQMCDTTKSLDKNGLPDIKEAQHPKARYGKRTGYHGNDRNNSFKGAIPGKFN